MPLANYSGKDAYVNGVPCTQSWSANDAVAATRYSASCTPGATNVGPGIKNWTGQAAGIGHHPAAVFPDGVAKAFKGVVNNDAVAGDLLSLDGNVVFEQLTIDLNKETSAPISWTATFGFNGVPSESATGAADATLANVKYADTLDIRIGASPVTITSVSLCIRTAQIVIRRPLTVWVKDGASHRAPGNLEADINFAVYSPSTAPAAFAENAISRLRVYTATDEAWDFNKIRFLGKSNFTVDRNSVNVIGYTVNGQWNSHDAGVKGYLAYVTALSGSPIATNYYGTWAA